MDEHGVSAEASTARWRVGLIRELTEWEMKLRIDAQVTKQTTWLTETAAEAVSGVAFGRGWHQTGWQYPRDRSNDGVSGVRWRRKPNWLMENHPEEDLHG